MGSQWKAAIWLIGEADEGVAALDGVIEEGEGVVLGHGGEPEGELGEVHGHGVAVHAVEAALGDEAAGEEEFVLIGRDDGEALVEVPGGDEFVGELAAGLDLEGSGADGDVADLEVEDGVRGAGGGRGGRGWARGSCGRWAR